MTTKDASKAFAIFAEYDVESSDSIAAGHDIIYAGPGHDRLTPAHLLELSDLGWAFDNRQQAWTHSL